MGHEVDAGQVAGDVDVADSVGEDFVDHLINIMIYSNKDRKKTTFYSIRKQAGLK